MKPRDILVISLLIFFLFAIVLCGCGGGEGEGTGRPAGTGTIRLAWDASDSPNILGYKIYYGTVSRDDPAWISYDHSRDVGNNLYDVLPPLPCGQKYYIAATAYTLSGQESDFSNEVCGEVLNNCLTRVCE